jgi:D-alanyl-lipoteichoic acid acyltransferase DltB (MBOAT superfamily)
MLFHSQAFVLLFLPVAVLLYYRFAHHVRLREYMLIAASLFFYSWWDYRFFPLILGQTVISWIFAELYLRRPVRAIIILAITLNLSVLGLFKYLNFFLENLHEISGLDLPQSNIILPIGISFYTFQIISYLADLLRKKSTPRYSLRRFVLYVTLFPQLIAGPIVRHNEIMSQFDLDPLRPGISERLSRGLVLFFIGLVEKVFIADKLAKIADPIYTAATTSIITIAETLTAVLAFTLQVFFDFSAYSDMAIGIGLMLGLTLPQNFNMPFRALTLTELWQRWHMTLTRFLGDYVFRPTYRKGRGFGQYIYAALFTMGLVGLWHGAGWTYVLWGLMQGFGLIVCRLWRKQSTRLPRIIAWALTFGFFTFTVGLFFRAKDLATSFRMISGLFGEAGLGVLPSLGTLSTIAITFAISLISLTGFEFATNRFKPRRLATVGLAFVAVYCLLEVGRGQPQNFIYFQF